MEPKDLKNSDELKSPEKEDLKKEHVNEPVADEAKTDEPVKSEKAPETKAKKEKLEEKKEEPKAKQEVKSKASEQDDENNKKSKTPVAGTEKTVAQPEKPAEKAEKVKPKAAAAEEEKPKVEPEQVDETLKPEKQDIEKDKKTAAPKAEKEDTADQTDKQEEKTEKVEPKAAAAEEEKPKDKPEQVEETAQPEKQEEKKETAEVTQGTTDQPVKAESKKADSEPDANKAVTGEKKEDKPESSEKGNEEKAEKKEPQKKKEPEKTDYSKYSQIELVNTMRDVLEESNDRDIKNDIEAIKAAFYKNMKENAEAAKKEFIEGGGAEADFKEEEDPYENDIKDLLRQYRQIRIEYNKKLDQEKEENLKKKYEVIEKIKGLINSEESINKTFNEFRALQQEWRDIGLVPQSKMKMLWDTYHFNVENFYDYIKINRELRDLDLKKNLEAKIKLCEKAEELLLDSSIIRAFNTLQKYHEQWREIGPVPREQKDDLWERFKAATTTINKKHQAFFENRKQEQKKNLEAKTALCEKVEAIDLDEMKSHKDWDKTSKELIELQKVWRTIGFAPRKDNNTIYERFRNACDNFFDAKRAFYARNKEEQQNNLQLKIDLCLQAEALKDSTDWKKTTQDLIQIQKKWKEIGPVPRKQSDSIWKRFRTACDYFFDKKSEHFSGMDSEYEDNLKLKQDLIQDIKNFKSSKNVEENLEKLKEFQRRWAEIGHVPYKKKDAIMSEFKESINKLYDSLKIDDEQRNLLKFRTKMSSYSETSRGQNKMRFERDKYMNKMKQLENDLVLLDNNIGFFAESKNAESLIKDVQNKIEMTKQKIELLKEKIRVIDEVDDDE